MSTASKCIRIALLGAESTGKTSLSLGLAKVLTGQGLNAVCVPESLRDWCEGHGRTPQAHEQADIAERHAQAIFFQSSEWVIADTTPLMTAVYSDFIFKDRSLYASALTHQAQFDLTLLMGLDVAWVADGLQRDGAHVREPVDGLIRRALQDAMLPFKVIYGQGDARLNAALLAISEGLGGLPQVSVLRNALPSLQSTHSQREVSQYGLNQGQTAWRCDLCSDSECEHRLFSDLLKSAGQ